MVPPAPARLGRRIPRSGGARCGRRGGCSTGRGSAASASWRPPAWLAAGAVFLKAGVRSSSPTRRAPRRPSGARRASLHGRGRLRRPTGPLGGGVCRDQSPAYFSQPDPRLLPHRAAWRNSRPVDGPRRREAGARRRPGRAGAGGTAGRELRLVLAPDRFHGQPSAPDHPARAERTPTRSPSATPPHSSSASPWRRPGTDLRNLASRSLEAVLTFLQGEKYFDQDAWTAAAGEYAKAAVRTRPSSSRGGGCWSPGSGRGRFPGESAAPSPDAAPISSRPSNPASCAP